MISVITITGIGDHLQPEWLITFTGMRIQGGLSASTDEIAWVQTAYLIADVIMVPMCGF
ncbi:MAG: transporter, family, multidrug resistance protein, partial [Bradyrhizobium sp.]